MQRKSGQISVKLAIAAIFSGVSFSAARNFDGIRGGINSEISDLYQFESIYGDGSSHRRLQSEFCMRLKDELGSLWEKYNDPYYNLVEGGKTAPILSKYEQGGSAIAVVTTNNENDVENLKRALQSLKFLTGDDPERPAPVVIFHEGDLSPDQMNAIIASTNRPITFPQVDLKSLPFGFDPKDAPQEDIRRYQMDRFWLTKVWTHPSLSPYEVIMKIDTDSCFMENNDLLPNLPNRHAMYMAEYEGLEMERAHAEGLWAWSGEWMNGQDRVPGNPLAWHFCRTTTELHGTIPKVRPHLEVFVKRFMHQCYHYQFMAALTEDEPFLLFNKKWSYGAIRYLMTAVLAGNHDFALVPQRGVAHQEMCQPEAYAKLHPWYIIE